MPNSLLFYTQNDTCHNWFLYSLEKSCRTFTMQLYSNSVFGIINFRFSRKAVSKSLYSFIWFWLMRKYLTLRRIALVPRLNGNQKNCFLLLFLLLCRRRFFERMHMHYGYHTHIKYISKQMS